MIVKLIERVRFLFLFTVLILFVLVKAVETEYELWQITDYFFLVLIAFSILVIGKKQNLLLFSLVLIALVEVFLFVLGNIIFPYHAQMLKYLFATLFMILMAIACLLFTMADKEINITTLFGSFSAYIFMGLAYAYLYLVLLAINPSAFYGIMPGKDSNAIYFSFITMTTVGFGDVIPLGSVAKTFAWLEAFTGQAYFATILAQLVGRYVAERLQRS